MEGADKKISIIFLKAHIHSLVWAAFNCCHPSLIWVAMILRKFVFFERFLFHYLIINIGYNEQSSIFYHTILA